MPKKEWKGRGRLKKARTAEKPNESEKEDAGDESVFDVDPPHGGKRASASWSEDVVDPSALDLDLHFTLDSHSHTTEQDVSNSTEHDLRPPHKTHNPPKSPRPT